MSQTENAAAALARNKLLGVLSKEALDALAMRGRPVNLEASERLFEKGDAADALYVVLEGEIEIGVTTPGGKYVRLAALQAGAVLGEMAVIDGGERSAGAVAQRRSKLLRMARASVLAALQEEPAALLALATELAARLRAANAMIESAVLSDLGSKLARQLLEESGAGAKLVQLTQSEMARRISVSREKLNRKLAEWREEGIIETGRSGLRILRIDALRHIAERSDED